MNLFDASKRIFSLAIPMAGTQLINVASSFLCMTMLAQLGHEVLAASALIYSTQIATIVTAMSMLFSLSVLIGHANGASQYKSIGNYVQQGWTVAILISIPLMIFYWNIGPVLIYFGQTPEIASIVQKFFHAYFFAVIPGMIATCNMQFGYGIHKKRLIVSTSFSGMVVLVASAYILIFGKFGIPPQGVAGLGYALTAQYSFFCIVTTLFFYFSAHFKKYELFRYRVFQHLDHFKQMFKVGWPICVQMSGEVMSLFATGIMVGWLGTHSLAAYQIANQYYFLAVIPLFSFSQASGILVGQANGAKQFHEIKVLGNASIAVVLSLNFIIALLFLGIPKILASAYIDVHSSDNAQVLHYTVIVFAILAFSQIFDGVRNILIGVTRGLFDTKFPMYMGLIVIWLIGMPLAYLFAFIFHWGLVGIVSGGLISMIIGASIMMARWLHLTRKYDGIISPS